MSTPYPVNADAEFAREWVLTFLPDDPADWIADTVREEWDNGRHPGDLDGPLAAAAEFLRVAVGAGGGPTRHAVTSRWDGQQRLELYVGEILALRPRVER